MKEIKIVRSENKMFLMVPITENQIDELANNIEGVKLFRKKKPKIKEGTKWNLTKSPGNGKIEKRVLIVIRKLDY